MRAVRTRGEATRKEAAFRALLWARISFLSSGFAVMLSALGEGGSSLTDGLLVAAAYAAMCFVSAFCVVRQPRVWALVLGVLWVLPAVGLLTGRTASPAALVGLAAVILGGMRLAEGRTLRAHPKLWDELLAEEPAGRARRSKAREAQWVVAAVGLVLSLGAAGYAWETVPRLPAPAELPAEVVLAGEFSRTWNKGDVHAISTWFSPADRENAVAALPGLVRGRGTATGRRSPTASPRATAPRWPSSTPVLSDLGNYLLTNWELQEERWVLVGIGLGKRAGLKGPGGR